jgi:hypothetical protein
MTRAEIVAWSEDAGRKLTSDRLSATPLSKTQRARVNALGSGRKDAPRTESHVSFATVGACATGSLRRLKAPPPAPSR